MLLQSGIKKLDLQDPRQAMVSARSYIRELIYSNVLPPGTIISQVELAQALGVSRTPLREALRMLQEEGLISAEANRRCRIAGFSPEDLDAVYSGRMLLEALGMRITLPQMRKEDIAALDAAVERMEGIEAELRSGSEEHLELWRETHRDFHLQMASKAPAALLEQIRSQGTRCERYLVSMVSARPFGSIAREGEHRQLVAMIREEDFDGAILENAKHRARTAIVLLGEAAFDFDPVAVRTALRMIATDGAGVGALSAVA